MNLYKAPELQIESWLNSEDPITLQNLRGQVVLIEFFQLLCPGCVSHGLPQAKLAAQTFGQDNLTVIGVHSVFEHHTAQGRQDVLTAFLHENRIRFPIGMDMPCSNDVLPKTMEAYQLQGTPSTILIDRKGNLCFHHFGQVNDMALGAEIMALINDRSDLDSPDKEADSSGGKINCDENGCLIGS